MRRSRQPHPHPRAQRRALQVSLGLGLGLHVIGITWLAWSGMRDAANVWPVLVTFLGIAAIFLALILFAAPDDQAESADHDLRPSRDVTPPRRAGEKGVSFQH